MPIWCTNTALSHFKLSRESHLAAAAVCTGYMYREIKGARSFVTTVKPNSDPPLTRPLDGGDVLIVKFTNQLNIEFHTILVQLICNVFATSALHAILFKMHTMMIIVAGKRFTQEPTRFLLFPRDGLVIRRRKLVMFCCFMIRPVPIYQYVLVHAVYKLIYFLRRIHEYYRGPHES